MDQALAVMKNDQGVPPCMSNCVVAKELLMSKMGNGGEGNGILGPLSIAQGSVSMKEQVAQQAAKNPGSRGHPELCLRPCLFHQSGKCKHGNKCSHCHLPHNKRPVRLDKRHRETLKKLSIGSLAACILPILQRKAERINLNPDAKSIFNELLVALEARAETRDLESLEVDGVFPFAEVRYQRKAKSGSCAGGNGFGDRSLASESTCVPMSSAASVATDSVSAGISIVDALWSMKVMPLLNIMSGRLKPDEGTDASCSEGEKEFELIKRLVCQVHKD
jgi:hypothetical protein